MEQELQKKKKTVQPVEENTQNIETEQATQEQAAGFDIEAIKAKIPKAFQGYVDPIIAWAQSVEQRFRVMEKTLPVETAKELERMALERQKEYVEKVQSGQATNPIQQPGGFNLGSLGPVLPYIMQAAGLGGQDNGLMDLNKKMMELNILRMQKDLDFTDSIKTAIVTKIAGKAASNLGEI